MSVPAWSVGVGPEGEMAVALNRIADALERLADAYLYCNAPEEEGEEARPGQSLSDVPARLIGVVER